MSIYKHGDWNVICDDTGFKLKASECGVTWNNKFVWKKVREPRQPQDYVRVFRDKQRVPIARTESSDTFLGDNDVSSEDL